MTSLFKIGYKAWNCFAFSFCSSSSRHSDLILSSSTTSAAFSFLHLAFPCHVFRPHTHLIVFALAGRKLVGGSNIGGIKETQEMLDFCAEHNIVSDIELIRMDDINAAMERLAKSDVKYRFVIDVANSTL